jgi:hypothetical protein
MRIGSRHEAIRAVVVQFQKTRANSPWNHKKRGRCQEQLDAMTFRSLTPLQPMREFDHRGFIVVAAGVMVVMAAAFWMYRSANTPEPTRHAFQIKAGDVTRVIVSPKRSGIRSQRNPHHLEYESAGGAVNVYVVRGNIGYRAVDRERVDKLTDELAAGQAPQDVFAKSSGERGRIHLGGAWLRHHEAYYLVFIRSENESEVTVVVHYGP